MESLIEAIPLIIAAIVPPLLAWFRSRVWSLVPDRYVPILLPVAGAAVAIGAQLAGFDLGDFDVKTADASTWQAVVTGILTGFAANGVHQVGKQVRKPPPEDETDRAGV